MATYGSADSTNTFRIPGSSNDWFTLVDQDSGEIHIYQDELIGNKRVGSIKPGGKLEYNDAWYAGVRNIEVTHGNRINKITYKKGIET